MSSIGDTKQILKVKSKNGPTKLHSTLNEHMHNLWLHAFKNIIRISDSKPLLYQSDLPNTQNNETPQKKEQQQENSKEILQKAPLNNSQNLSSQNSPLNSSVNSNNTPKDNSLASKDQNDSNSQNKGYENIKKDSVINTQSENSDDSNCSGRKKKKSVFTKGNKKSHLSSRFKQKKKFEDFWEKRVKPARDRIIQKKSNNNKEQIKTLLEKQNDQQITSNESETNNLTPEVSIVQLDQQNMDTLYSDSKNFSETSRIFKINEERHPKKANKINSHLESTGKKHRANIFDDIADEEVQDQPLNIQLQQRQSQNGWDGNDLDLLQNILKQNSLQLKDNKKSSSRIVEDHKYAEDDITIEDIQKEQLSKQNGQKYNEKQEILKKQEINKNEYKLNNYDEWDVELDNIITPVQKQHKQDNLSHQFFQRNNNNNINNNQSCGNHLLLQNKYMGTQMNSITKQHQQQQQQIKVLDNDYDNWDEEM